MKIDKYYHLYGRKSDVVFEEIPNPVRHGRWEVIDDTEFRVTGWYCSLCNYQISDRYGKYNYCPNCGADMRGEQDE